MADRHRPPEETRLMRLLLMARLLCQERVSRAGLASRLDLSERQVQRDITLLRRAGVRISRTREGYLILACPVCAELEQPDPAPDP